MLLNVKFQRFWGFHHLQYIILLKYSQNGEKSLYERYEAENQYWMPVILGLSGDTALNPDS